MQSRRVERKSRKDKHVNLSLNLTHPAYAKKTFPVARWITDAHYGGKQPAHSSAASPPRPLRSPPLFWAYPQRPSAAVSGPGTFGNTALVAARACGNPPAGNAVHAVCSAASRLEPNCCSPRARTASRRRAPCRSPCRLERTWSSPRVGSGGHPHAQRSAVRLGETIWDSPRACTAGRLRALCKSSCCLQRPWSSPRGDNEGLPHAPGSAENRRCEPPPSSNPPPGTACLLHALYSAGCHLPQMPWSTPHVGTACPRHAACNAGCRL
jgi:hypothetical protein